MDKEMTIAIPDLTDTTIMLKILGEIKDLMKNQILVVQEFNNPLKHDEFIINKISYEIESSLKKRIKNYLNLSWHVYEDQSRLNQFIRQMTKEQIEESYLKLSFKDFEDKRDYQYEVKEISEATKQTEMVIQYHRVRDWWVLRIIKSIDTFTKQTTIYDIDVFLCDSFDIEEAVNLQNTLTIMEIVNAWFKRIYFHSRLKFASFRYQKEMISYIDETMSMLFTDMKCSICQEKLECRSNTFSNIQFITRMTHLSIYSKGNSYIFNISSLEDLKEGGREMIKRYKPHKYFLDDYFGLVGEKRRPPYRWFLMGPKRSGTTVHIDPLATSAWNTSLQGHKLWVLFPPDIPKCVVKAKGLAVKNLIDQEDLDEAIDYFMYALPKLIETEGADNLKVQMCIQGPGETIFVPGNWWHAVLNLDNTMALTQNFVSETNFERVWRSVRCQRPKFGVKWLSSMEEKNRRLHDRAIEINSIDQAYKKAINKPETILHQLSSDSNERSSSSSSSSSSSDSSSDSSDESH